MRGEAASVSKAELAKGLPCPAAERWRLKVVGSRRGKAGRSGRPKNESERSEIRRSERVVQLESPERGNYVVWPDSTVTFATFPTRRERDEEKERDKFGNRAMLLKA